MYHQSNIQKFYVLPTAVFMCFVWISEQTAIISLYNINWLVFITETVCLLRGTDWVFQWRLVLDFNPLNPELNPICYLLALLSHHFLHVSRIRVKLLTFRWLIYIYGAPILDVSRSHTTTQHTFRWLIYIYGAPILDVSRSHTTTQHSR